MPIRQEVLALFVVISWLLSACTTANTEPPAGETSTPAPIRIQPTATVWPDPTPRPLCHEQHGRLVRETLDAPRRGAPFPFVVYLPPCYDFSSQAYPVLYLLHGLTYDENQWLDLGLAVQADALMSAGEIAPFIIVLPRDPTWKPPAEDDFDEFLLQTLLPYMDAAYRTLPDARHRGLGGLSRGGGWALRLGLLHTDLFGVLGLHAPAIFWGDEKRLDAWMQAVPPENIPCVYLDSGDNDPGLSQTRYLEDLLTAHAWPHEWHLFRGWHENAYWQAHMAGYLRWYGQSLGECQP